MATGAAWAGVVPRDAAIRASDAMTANCSAVNTPPAERLGVKTKDERFMNMLLGQGGIKPAAVWCIE
jgi:hypothetical protein